MRTVLLANGSLGARSARWLADRGELAGLVLHQPDRQRDVEGLGAELDVPAWTWPAPLTEIAALAPACLLSVLFGHRLDGAWLSTPTWRAINLHPSLLPHNAGANPNIWPLVDGSPAGTTLHVMSEQIDAGEILAQREVDTRPDDTGRTLYDRLLDASFELLCATWPGIEAIAPTPQGPGGSYHRSADTAALHLDPSELPLIDRLRALTFPPYGAEFDRDGRRWRVRVEIEEIGHDER